MGQRPGGGDNRSCSESNFGLSVRGEYADDKEYGNDHQLGMSYLTLKS